MFRGCALVISDRNYEKKLSKSVNKNIAKTKVAQLYWCTVYLQRPNFRTIKTAWRVPCILCRFLLPVKMWNRATAANCYPSRTVHCQFISPGKHRRYASVVEIISACRVFLPHNGIAQHCIYANAAAITSVQPSVTLVYSVKTTAIVIELFPSASHAVILWFYLSTQ